jgi:hypothetical protein
MPLLVFLSILNTELLAERILSTTCGAASLGFRWGTNDLKSTLCPQELGWAMSFVLKPPDKGLCPHIVDLI